MSEKINLITEPDILANDNLALLILNLSDEDEQLITDYLKANNLRQSINLYVQKDNQTNLYWMLNVFAHCKYVAINLDAIDPLVGTYATYFIGRSKTYFYTQSEDMAAVMSPISVNRIEKITDFFEKIGLIDHGQDT